MKRRLPLRLLPVVLLSVSGLLLAPSVRWPVWGWLRGEAFYQGKPTSWWAKEIQEAYHPEEPFAGSASAQAFPKWYALPSPPWYKPWLKQSDFKYIMGGPLLCGSPDALPVLLALLQNESAKVRRMAISGLLAQGKQTPEAVEALRKATEDPEPDVRRDSTLAMQQIEGQREK